MKRCPKCGAELQDTDQFCTFCGATADQQPVERTCAKCGAPLEEDEAFCMSCGAKVRQTEDEPAGLTCSNCGTQLDTGDLFCTKCGTRVPGKTPTASGSTVSHGSTSPQDEIEQSADQASFAPNATKPVNLTKSDSSLGAVPPQTSGSYDQTHSSADRTSFAPDATKTVNLTKSDSAPGAVPHRTSEPYVEARSADDAFRSQSPGVPKTEPPAKKKSKRRTVTIIVIATLAVLAAVFVYLNRGGQIDYIGSVKAWEPYARTMALPYTVNDVMDRYMPNASWAEESLTDGSALVTASGQVQDDPALTAFTFEVTSDSEDSDSAHFKVISATNDGEKYQGDPSEVLLFLFQTYDEELSAEQLPGEGETPEPTMGPPTAAAVTPPITTPSPVASPPATPSPSARVAPSGFDPNGFVFADSSERYLSPEELIGLSAEMLGFARNEIFARNGNLFRKDKYIQHFSAYDWYNSIPNKRYDIDLEELNPYERANVVLIQEREAEIG